MNKKLLSLLAILPMTISMVSCNKKQEEVEEEPTVEEDTSIKKHLILDEDGNYGGSLDEDLYGLGAPLNGEYDVEDSIYYPRNDFYNLKSNRNRSMINSFEPYQQTMANTDGIACALMIFNHDGKDIKNEFSELSLYEKYLELNDVDNMDNGATPEGLGQLFTSKGYTAEVNPYTPTGSGSGAKAYNLERYVKDQIEDGNIVMVRFQDGMNFRWHIILGVDNLGTAREEIVRDDVFIFADPFDDSDHFQDGYSISAVSRFNTWWLRQKLNVSGTSDEHQMIVVTPKVATKIEKDTTDIMIRTGSYELPEKHFLLNADESFGGTLDEVLYGTVEEQNTYLYGNKNLGGIEHSEYNYFSQPDYFNLGNTQSRHLLSEFSPFEQTMASSCGISSMLMILTYYGHNFSNIHTNSHILNRQRLFDQGKKPKSGSTTLNYWNSTHTPTFGAIAPNDFGRKQEALTLIYMDQDSAFNDGTKLFNNYGGVGAPKLSNVPTALGYEAYGVNYGTKKAGCYWDNYSDFLAYVQDNISKGQPIATGWCPVSGHWTVIIGIDTMDTDYIYDDVIIIADAHDVSDHYQDGYNTYPATMFFGQFRNGGGTVFQQHVVITNPNR